MPKKKQKSSLNAAKGARGSHHCKGGGEGGIGSGEGGKKVRVREACKAPSGAERAVEAETHGVGPEVRASRERASAGKAWGALDSCRQGEADAKRSRNTAEQQSKQLRITLARVEAELAALKAKHPPPVPVPLIIPDTIPVTVESVSEAPKYKKYNSESSARRAAKRVRKVICEYPPDCRADLLARVMVTDGRGKELQISVSNRLACVPTHGCDHA